jgi:trimeric autotransporter adhesin
MSTLLPLFLALASPLQTPTCTPAWLPTFGAEPGFDGEARAAVTFDDGSGPKLYVGGAFTTAGGALAKNIACWDGANWSTVDIGLSAPVNALAVFDDGTGPALYAGGVFFQTLTQPLSYIARWDGSTWSPLGSGMGNQVHALAVWDDGTGSALYAAGDFTSAGGVNANRIAKWDGQTWSALGTGLNGRAEALVVHNDGSGPALYAGGSFTGAGGQSAQRLARWNGAVWSPLGAGANSAVYALASYPSGPNQRLYVGGEFSSIGGQSIASLASWNGSGFSAVGGPATGIVRALRVFDDGSGSALYAGFQFGTVIGLGSSIVRWNGTSWSATAGAPNGQVRALTPFPEGAGAKLHAMGGFVAVGGQAAPRIARLDAAGWVPLAIGGLAGTVRVIRSFDDGSGPAVYVGGDFTSIGNQPIQYLARWSAGQWSAINGAPNGGVEALEVFDFGGGPGLYVGGSFSQAGNQSAGGLARWDGSTWSTFGSGFVSGAPPFTAPGGVRALAAFDDGSGLALHAAGSFTSAGGAPIRYLARWNGTAWSSLGAGVPASFVSIYSLAVADIGSGPVLVAGGLSTQAGVGPKGVLRWNGIDFGPIGAGLSTSSPQFFGAIVEDLAVYDDGSGPMLYAGGFFDVSGVQPANRIARWNGTRWENVGNGVDQAVRALTVFDDGFGEALYAGGEFLNAGGAPAPRLARWDGSTWSPVAKLLNGTVWAIDGVEEAGGPALLVGGAFTISPAQDAYLARWKRCGLEALADVPGCLGNSAGLRSLSAGLVQGQNAAFESHSDQGDGLALLFAGPDGTDASGCGLFVPGLGELLLSAVPGLFQVGAAPTALGSGSFQVPIPTAPALLGKEVLLQSAHVLLSLPGVPLELSNGLLGRILL